MSNYTAFCQNNQLLMITVIESRDAPIRLLQSRFRYLDFCFPDNLDFAYFGLVIG